MPQNYKILGQAFVNPNTALSNIYVTDSQSSAVINSIYICNQGIDSANVRMILRPINEALSPKHTILIDEPVPAVSTFVLNLGITVGPNMILAANTTYSANQVPPSISVSNTSFSAFGLEIT